MSSRKSRSILWVVGGVLAIGGVSVGVEVLRKTEDKIADMVRTPSGCESNVRFTGTGEFFVYVETKGVVGDLGDCGNDERVYSLDRTPDAEVMITSLDGAAVELKDDSSVEYSTTDFAGVSVFSFDVNRADEFVVSVGGDADTVVAIGRNVAPESQPAFMIAAFTMLAGIIVMITALAQTISSRRRSRRAPLVVNYADGTMTWAPPSVEDRAIRGDAER